MRRTVIVPTEPRRESSPVPGSSEAHDHRGRGLNLIQRPLTEPERIAEVAGLFVVEHRRLVSNLPANADVAPREVFDAAAESERELGLGFEVVGAEDIHAKAREQDRRDANPGAPDDRRRCPAPGSPSS